MSDDSLQNPKFVAAKIALLQAEARKADAETRAAQADAAVKEAESRQKKAHALAAEFGAESMRVQTEATLRQEKLTLAGNHYFHEYEFSGQVHEDSVANCLAQLAIWHRLDPQCDMHIIMDSPGGSVIDGMHLFDQLTAYSTRPWDRGLRPKGDHKTRITVRGYAASMAGILLQAADERVIGPESFLMIHEVSSFAAGKIGEIKDEIKFLDKITDRVVDIFLTRAKGKIDKKTFLKNWSRTDWWLTSEEALNYGFVDRIG